MTRSAARVTPTRQEGASMAPSRGGTTVEVVGEDFVINGRLSYEGASNPGLRLEGLLLNSRMANAIFDDLNPETRHRWAYPDTGDWDPDRNTAEFVAAMPAWRRCGLLAVTVGVQGGNPCQYTPHQPWVNPGYAADGTPLPAYLSRLSMVLDRADELGMAVILNPFYFGQDHHLADSAAIGRALDELVTWVLESGWGNVVLDLVNECNIPRYTHACLTAPQVPDLIRRARAIEIAGRRLLTGTSFAVISPPTPEVVDCSDIVYLHGNEVDDPGQIAAMVDAVRSMPAYRGQPIVFNEDDHFNFGAERNNMTSALRSHSSWGFFDPGHNDYHDGFQSVPVRWEISTALKKEFFDAIRSLSALAHADGRSSR
jgi:hypothetical protein